MSPLQGREYTVNLLGSIPTQGQDPGLGYMTPLGSDDALKGLYILG